jgi:hypothetical protein
MFAAVKKEQQDPATAAWEEHELGQLDQAETSLTFMKVCFVLYLHRFFASGRSIGPC